MLNKASLNAAYPLAQILSQKGLSLEALEQTPLEELVECSTVNLTVEALPMFGTDNLPIARNDLDISQELMDAASAPNALGVVEHDEFMHTATQRAAEAVEASLKLARNVVNPLIEKVLEDTKASMNQATAEYLDRVEIQPFHYARVWNNPMLADLVAKYRDAYPKTVELHGLCPVPQNVEAWLMTGSAMLDDNIRELAVKLGEAAIADVWDHVFGTSPVKDLNDYLKGRYSNANRALVCFLLASHLEASIPEGLNISMEDYQNYIRQIKAEAGRLVANTFKQREGDVKIKRLIVQVPDADRDGWRVGPIVVVGDVYNQWLKDGGSPEALMGGVIQGGATNYKDLLDGKNAYEKEWQRTYSLMKSKAYADQFKAFVAGLRDAVTRQINDMGVEYGVVDVAPCHERLKALTANLTSKDLDDVWGTVRRVVCRVFFPDTAVEKLLTAIDKFGKEHPDLSAREAGLLAVIDYVTEWVAAQLKPQKVTV